MILLLTKSDQSGILALQVDPHRPFRKDLHSEESTKGISMHTHYLFGPLLVFTVSYIECENNFPILILKHEILDTTQGERETT
jgi:hypothetical protein